LGLHAVQSGQRLQSQHQPAEQQRIILRASPQMSVDV